MTAARLFQRTRRQRGLCFAVLAILLPVILVFTGIGIDIGVLALARAHLKTVADSAALAGAKPLNDRARLAENFDISNDMHRARDRAIAIGQANTVLGKQAVLLRNAGNNSGGDIVIGYKNMSVAGSSLDSDANSKRLFNSVQVTARCSEERGGLVPAFFSKAIGFNGTAVSVSSTATVQNYSVQGFRCTPPATHVKLIPITLSLPN